MNISGMNTSGMNGVDTSTPRSDLLDSFLMDAYDALGSLEQHAHTLADTPSLSEPLLKDLAIVTHRLKGSAALYNFPQVAKLAELAEQLLAHSSKLPAKEAARLHTLLEQFTTCLRGALERIAATGSEGQLGLEFSQLGGATLLLSLLREYPEAFVRQRRTSAELEAAPGTSLAAGLSAQLRTFYQRHPDLWEFFAPEAGEHIETLNLTLEAVQTQGTDETRLGSLFRATHTLKGAAYAVGLTPMGDLAHRLEDLMVHVREGDRLFDQAVREGLAAGSEVLSTMLLAAEGRPTRLEPLAAQLAARLDTLLGKVADAPVSASLGATLRAFRTNNPDWTYFAPEASEWVTTITTTLETLRATSGHDSEALGQLFRAATTLKGSAYTVGFAAMGDLAHRLEQLSTALQGGEFGWDAAHEVLTELSEVLGMMLAAAKGEETSLETALPPLEDALEALLGEGFATDTTDNGHQSAQEPGGLASYTRPTIRVGLDKLDALLDTVGEMTSSRARFTTLQSRFASLQALLGSSRGRLLRTVSEFEAQYLNPRLNEAGSAPVAPDPAQHTLGASLEERFDELEFDTYNDLNILARSVAEMNDDLSDVETQLATLTQTLHDETEGFQRLLRDLRHDVSRTRMVPIRQLFTRLKRLAKQATDKQAAIVVKGEAVEVDNVILEGLSEALLHLVKNALHHGLEPNALRQAQGKPEVGTVQIRAYPKANHVFIEVEDDGAGIDLEAVKRQAVARGLRSEAEVARLSAEEALALIFLPGLSTAEVVTSEAGRGVGMDAVADTIHRLKGEILMRTERGYGTLFTIKLPLTLVVSDALFVRVAGQTLAFAADAVQGLRTLPQASITRFEEGDDPSILFEGEMLRLYPLAPLLELESVAESIAGSIAGSVALERDEVSVVVLRSGEERFALAVDGFLGLEEVVVRGLPAMLEPLAHLAGTTLSRTGEIVLLLDPAGVRRLDRVHVPAGPVVSVRETPGRQARRPRLLLVDDSVSVRRVVSRMLERSGYEVTTAGDGQEALELLADTLTGTPGDNPGDTFLAVVTDLEMPRVNGYELIEELRRRPGTRTLPILVMTTRAGEKHMKLAFELGANHYLFKPIDEGKLLRALQGPV